MFAINFKWGYLFVGEFMRKQEKTMISCSYENGYFGIIMQEL